MFFYLKLNYIIFKLNIIHIIYVPIDIMYLRYQGHQQNRVYFSIQDVPDIFTNSNIFYFLKNCIKIFNFSLKYSN